MRKKYNILILTILMIMMIPLKTYSQAILQGLNHPDNAQGWGIQALSTRFENGSGISRNPSTINLSSNFVSINYTNYMLDVNAGGISYLSSLPIGKYHISIKNLNYGNFTERNEQGEELGDYGANDLYSRFTWGDKLYNDLYIGMNVNYSYLNISHWQAHYLTYDFGLIYRLFGTTIGLSTTNHTITAKGYEIPEDPGSMVILGISRDLKYSPMKLSLDVIRESNDNYIVNFGGNIDFSDNFRIFYGVTSKKEDLDTYDTFSNIFSGLSGGFGISVKNYDINFGLRNLGVMGNILSCSIKYDL